MFCVLQTHKFPKSGKMKIRYAFMVYLVLAQRSSVKLRGIVRSQFFLSFRCGVPLLKFLFSWRIFLVKMAPVGLTQRVAHWKLVRRSFGSELLV